jgi:hypothetical protein
MLDGSRQMKKPKRKRSGPGESDRRVWQKHGHLHRSNGPAVEWDSGTKSWWLHGQRHRVGGPAIEYRSPTGGNTLEWYIRGTIR